MDANLLVQLLVAIVPAIFSGVVSYLIATKNCKNEIAILKTSNKHEIEKLMKRHEIDIESLKEKHKLDMETKEKEHQLRIEEIKVKSEQEILKKEKELLNSATYSIMGDATKELFSGMLNSPDVKNALNEKIKESLKK